MNLDTKNGNKKWQDATELEMSLMKEYAVFKSMCCNAGIPKGHTKIQVHIIYDVKHNSEHQARLVADGHLMNLPVKSGHSGIVF